MLFLLIPSRRMTIISEIAHLYNMASESEPTGSHSPQLPKANPPQSLSRKDNPEDQDDWKLWKQEWLNYAKITTLLTPN